MKCPFCGSEIADSAKFWYSCGGKILDAAAGAAGSVQDTLNEMGSAANSYVDQLGSTAQQYADALQSGGSVTDDDYLEALKKAEQTVQNGVEAAYPGTNGAPSSGTYSAPDAGTYTAPAAGSYSAPDSGSYAPPAYTPTSNYTAKQNKQRAKNLLSALWHSGKLAKLVVFVAAALIFFLIFSGFGGSKGGKVHGGGYNDYKDLISDYISTMQKENYSTAIKGHTDQVVNYFKEGGVTDPKKFLETMDDACRDNIYAAIDSWELGEEVDWDPAEYYADDFAELGINAATGKDVNVNFKFKNGADPDYYVFELVQIGSKWYILSVYY